MSTTEKISSHDGQTFNALYAAAGATAPAIVLMQEIFGINQAMKEAARNGSPLGDHAFARKDGDAFVARAAELAEQRSLAFMTKYSA